MDTRTRPHVVIIGGGFAGLFAARALRRARVDVTLVDRAAHHVFQPLLYQCATGTLSNGQISRSLREELLRVTATSPPCSARRSTSTPTRAGSPPAAPTATTFTLTTTC